MSRLFPVILLVTLPFVAVAVQWGSRNIPPIDDDLDHLSGVAKVDRGEMSLPAFVLESHGPHWLPLWKTWYFLQWKLSGTSFWQWHLAVTIHHAVSAVFLYFLLTGYLESRWACFVAAFLWAGDGVGGWDNPFSWNASTHFALSMTWMLGAMACVPRMQGQHAIRWGLLLLLSLTLSLLFMSSMFVVGLFLPALYALTPRTTAAPRVERFALLACWITPMLVITALQFVLAHGEGAPTAATVSLFRPVGTTIGHFVIAIDNLRFLPYSTPTATGVTGIGCLLVLAVAAGMVTLRRNAAILVLIFFLMAITLTFGACFGRIHISPRAVLSWGRYHYLPSLFWCVALGALLDRPLSAGGKGTLITAICLVLVMPLYLARQIHLIGETPQRHWDKAEIFVGRQQALLYLSELSTHNNRIARVPNHKVFENLKITMSEFAWIGFRGQLAGVEFVDPQSLTQDDKIWLTQAGEAQRARISPNTKLPRAK